MNRLFLIQNEYGNLLLINNNKKIVYRNAEVISFLNLLSTKEKPMDLREPISDVLVAEYRDLQIVIDSNKYPINDNNINKLKPFFDSLICMQKRKSIGSKKVNRNNKYAPCVIAAASLLAGIILISSMNSNKNIKNEDNILKTYNYDNDVQVVEVVNDNITEDSDFLYTKEPDFVYSTEDKYLSDKAVECRCNYGTMISYYAGMYGVDANVLNAIAVQERGEHSNQIDSGGAVGLMQIQYGVWINKEISAYNFYTGSYEKILVTDEMLRNVETNIQLGSIILQNCFLEFNNPIAAIQSYNYGDYIVKEIILKYAFDNYGVSDINAVFANNDYGWVNDDYLSIYDSNGNSYGDSQYINHVFSYLDPSINEIIFKNIPKYENGKITSQNESITVCYNSIKDNEKIPSF